MMKELRNKGARFVFVVRRDLAAPYEDLYRDGVVTDRWATWLAARFPIRFAGPLVPAIGVNRVTKADVIQNLAEVQEAVIRLIDETARVPF